MVRLVTLVALAPLVAVPGVAGAQGHGPVFGLSTPTLSAGAWSVDLPMMGRVTDAGSMMMLRPMVSYGVTEDFQISASFPIPLYRRENLRPTRATTRMPATSDVELTAGWRFHRQGLAVGTRFESTAYVSVDYPTEPTRAGLAAAPGLIAAAVTGYASRRFYAWGGGLFRRYLSPSGPTADHLGDLVMYSLVLGYRPPFFRDDVPKPDWRLFLEGVGYMRLLWQRQTADGSGKIGIRLRIEMPRSARLMRAPPRGWRRVCDVAVRRDCTQFGGRAPNNKTSSGPGAVKTLATPLALLILSQPLVAQDILRPTAVYGSGDPFLYGVLAASASGPAVSVLTEPEPAVHVVAPGSVSQWGREGGGPAELRSPVDITWNGGWIHVLDIGNRKFVRFDEAGEFSHSRSLGSTWARTMEIAGEDTILGTFVPMTDQHAVVRLRGEEIDTLLSFRLLGRSHTLNAPGAPSLTIKAPFSNQLRWAVMEDASLVWYDPESDELIYVDRDGVESGRLPVRWRGTEVTEADQEWWIANEIPSEFMGQRGFEPLREVAREELEFPSRHSPVMALESDPSGGTWVKRSLESQGEIWMLLMRSGEARGRFRLPLGRRLVAVSASHIFALRKDERDLETIEAYARPDWAG